MRALFDLKHPAQVLVFKDLIQILLGEGHQVLVTSRAKDETLDLLNGLGIRHIFLSSMSGGLARMGLELGWRTARMLGIVRRFRPDVLLAKTGITIAMVGKLLRVPSIVFDDTEFASLQIALSAPFATVVCTGMGYGRRFPGKEVRYNAPPHLAYTHPSRCRPAGRGVRGPRRVHARFAETFYAGIGPRPGGNSGWMQDFRRFPEPACEERIRLYVERVGRRN